MEGKKQLFRQYDRFNGDTFLEFLKYNPFQIPKMPSVYGQGVTALQVKEGNQIF